LQEVENRPPKAENPRKWANMKNPKHLENHKQNASRKASEAAERIQSRNRAKTGRPLYFTDESRKAENGQNIKP
jgi:hypothetical protein